MLGRLRTFIRSLYLGQFGFVSDTFLSALSVVACGVYLATCYLRYSLGKMPPALAALEWIFFVCFTWDYVVKVFLAEDKLFYVLSYEGVSAFASIVPVFTIQSQTSLGFLRILRVHRLAEMLQHHNTINPYNAQNPAAGRSAARQIGSIVLILLTYTFISSGLIYSLEVVRPGSFFFPGAETCDLVEFLHRPGRDVSDLPRDCHLTYFTGVYFVFITVFSVGYGDIVPRTDVARLLTLMVLVPLFFILLNEVNRLLEIYNAKNKYSNPFPGSPHGHIIVCGSLHVRTLV